MLFSHKKPEAHFTVGASPTKEPRPDGVNSQSAPSDPSPQSVIDASLVITGNLQSEHDLKVDGEVNGDVRCSQLIFGRDATINGNIVADAVVVRGKVKGVIHADQVTLQDTARVESDIFHKSLLIEEGARVNGEIRRKEQPTPPDVKSDGDPAAASTTSLSPRVVQHDGAVPTDLAVTATE
jgi:cytoskeletal protein CcmA (bactofilin family)